MNPSVTMQVLQGVSLGASFVTPGVHASWADKTEWFVYIGAVTGAPTTASVTAKFQVYMPNITAANEENTTGAWVDVTPTTNPEMFPAGALPASFATEATAAAVGYVIPIVTRLRHRMSFTLAFSGGSSPAFPFTIRYVSA